MVPILLFISISKDFEKSLYCKLIFILLNNILILSKFYIKILKY